MISAMPPTTVDEYLAGIPDDQRAVLEHLRATIAAAAPDATEVISYEMPAFRDRGRFLVSYSAFKEHCSLFPASEGVQEALGEQLAPYLSGKGTIRFTVDAPLPDAMVTKIVEARLAENAAIRDRTA
jgi:uncharacterized protein YdhG (YjbR/CyaY superfamily)